MAHVASPRSHHPESLPTIDYQASPKRLLRPESLSWLHKNRHQPVKKNLTSAAQITCWRSYFFGFNLHAMEPTNGTAAMLHNFRQRVRSRKFSGPTASCTTSAFAIVSTAIALVYTRVPTSNDMLFGLGSRLASSHRGSLPGQAHS